MTVPHLHLRRTHDKTKNRIHLGLRLQKALQKLDDKGRLAVCVFGVDRTLEAILCRDAATQAAPQGASPTGCKDWGTSPVGLPELTGIILLLSAPQSPNRDVSRMKGRKVMLAKQFQSARAVFTGVLLSTLLFASTVALAQTTSKTHKPAADSNRVVNKDLGFSYVPPATYVPGTMTGAALFLRDPEVGQTESVAHVEGQNFKATLDLYLSTGLEVVVRPRIKGTDFSENRGPEGAKRMLATVNASLQGTGLLFNYQNSANIKIAGHDAVAILAESSVPDISDRVMMRIILVNHRDHTILFAFHSDDTQFETRVPAFDNFMASVKFLQPDMVPADAKPTAPGTPVSIKIGR